MSTDRYTSRSGETPPQSPKLPADARFKGKEDYRLLADPLPTPQAETLNKLSQGQLLGLLEWLVPRDLEILNSLRSAKYLLTGQIQRLHVPVIKSPSGAIRNTSNTMRKLKSYGLVKTFQRRIGGARAGSSSLIWCLTEAGQRFLNARDGLETTRRSHRYLEPSYVHIRHTLAIAECYVPVSYTHLSARRGSGDLFQLSGRHPWRLRPLRYGEPVPRLWGGLPKRRGFGGGGHLRHLPRQRPQRADRTDAAALPRKREQSLL